MIPENFEEYHGETMMSNFDGEIINETAVAIKGKELFSRYSGWNFNGIVYWENDQWNCDVWTYGSYNETVSGSPEEIMSEVSDKYGYE